MVSYRQLESNRRNASRSTGPRTPAGKLKSARNAFKHGLTALVFKNECEISHPQEEIEQAMAAAYHPNTPEEHELIRKMVQGHLRAQICRHHMQEKFFAAKRGQHEFEGRRGYCGTTLHQLDAMRLIMRYLTGHERSVERANQLFYAPRLARLGVTQTKQSLTGFVSQNRRYRRSRHPKLTPHP